jgi:hypothetical protein
MLGNVFYFLHSTLWTAIACAIMIPRLVEGQQPSPVQMAWCAVALWALCTMWAFTVNLIYYTEQ